MHVCIGKVTVNPSVLLIGCAYDLSHSLMKTGTVVSLCLYFLFASFGCCNLMFAK